MLEVRNGRFAQGVLGHPVTRYCGRISYGLYVYHLPVIWAWYSLAPRINLAWFALGSFATTIALAVLSFELFERRCLRLKDRWFPSRPSADARAALLSASG
jgi:peptidoglycan/LPS O-acetylase OafA/YrhL